MKRLALVALLAASVGLAACGGNDSSVRSARPKRSAQPTTTTTTTARTGVDASLLATIDNGAADQVTYAGSSALPVLRRSSRRADERLWLGYGY